MALFYGIHDKWTDINKENDVLVQSTEGVIDSIKVNGEEYGGGGSEFSTAVMTITVDSNETYLALPHITENGISTETLALTAGANEITVPLYNGKLIVYDDFNATFSETSGDIEYDANFNYVITGNCAVHYIAV